MLLCVISAQQHNRHKFCCIIQFLCAEGAIPVDVHSWLKHVFGDEGLQCVQWWYGDLAHPEYPPHSVDPDTQATVDQMVQCCWYIMLWHISEHLGITLECASHHHARYGLLKSFCSMGTEQFKRRTDGNWNGCLLGTSAVVWKRGGEVFGSYCWRVQVLEFALWSRDYTMCQHWKHPSSPWLKKSHTVPCTGKVLLTLFITCCGPLLIDCLPTTSPSLLTATVKPWSTWVQ